MSSVISSTVASTDAHLLLLAMEDAHAAILGIDEEHGDRNAFFAVYDGHGGMSDASYLSSYLLDVFSGSHVAKFAGQNVHKRLILEKSYTEKNYEIAFKEAFLDIDQELRIGVSPSYSLSSVQLSRYPLRPIATQKTIWLHCCCCLDHRK